MTTDRWNRRSLWMLSLVILPPLLVFIYPLALDIPLLDPDEGIFAAISRAMCESGDWVTPRFLGEPFFSKPILYFWSQALSLRLFGIHEAALRLPPLLFGLFGVITTGAVAWRMFGRKTGILAALFYTTTALPIALSQSPAHDVTLIPWINLAILGFWESERAATRARAWGCILAVGVALGVACLAKGGLGLSTVGATWGAYLLVTRRLTLAACLRGLAALIAAPWFLAMAARNPGYFHYYFVERHLMGYATNTQPHSGRPFWYYLPIVLAGGLPWIIYIPAALHDAWQRRKQCPRGRGDGVATLMICWILGCTLFLSLAHSKLVTYIWPVFPPLAILSATVWTRFFDDSLAPAWRRALALAFRVWSWIALLALPLSLAIVHVVYRLPIAPLEWIAALAVAAVAAVPLGFWKTGRTNQALLTSILSLSVQFAAFMTIVGPGLSPQFSARDLAAHFNAQGRVPPRVLLVEQRVASIAFYLDSRLRAELRPGQLEGFRLARLEELPTVEPGTVVAVPQRWLEQTGRCVNLSGIAYQPVGHYRLYEAAPLAQAFMATVKGNTLLAARPAGAQQRDLKTTVAR